MKARRYVLYSIIYVALIWVFVFTFFNQNFSLSILEYTLDLPVASWVVIPIALFALLSIFHISYYGFKNFLDARAVKNDLNLYSSLAKEVFLGLESNKDFKTDLFQIPSEVTKSLSPWLNLGEPNLKNEDLKLAYEISKKIKNGEVCDLKKFKLLKTNPLFIQNEKNKIKADYKYALNIPSSKIDASDSLYQEALDSALNNATYLELSKFGFNYSNEDIMKLINRYINGTLEISSQDLFNLINKNEFQTDEYISLATHLKTKLDPDKLMGVFDRLKNEHSNANEAYLYILYDLQMIDNLREIITSSQDGEFDKIKTLLFLREHGKLAPASLFYK